MSQDEEHSRYEDREESPTRNLLSAFDRVSVSGKGCSKQRAKRKYYAERYLTDLSKQARGSWSVGALCPFLPGVWNLLGTRCRTPTSSSPFTRRVEPRLLFTSELASSVKRTTSGSGPSGVSGLSTFLVRSDCAACPVSSLDT